MTILQWALLISGVLMSAAGGFFLKVGALQIDYNEGLANVFRQVAFNWSIIFGIAMYFIPVMVWIYLLKKIELSFLQPLFSLTYVVTPILATLFLNENVTFARWLGIIVIILGVIVVAKN